MTKTVYSTQSLCPECLAVIPARHICSNERVFLVKKCPQHGEFRTLVWKGQPQIDARYRVKDPVTRRPEWKNSEKGCPYDCGICAEHRQYGCIVLMEITQRCNLKCPVCFAGAGPETTADPSQGQILTWYRMGRNSGPNPMVQLSGGEPTLRDDLPEIVSLGRSAGYEFIQVNSNGIRLAEDPQFVKKLAEAGLSSVYLQFDGTSDDIYQSIRGRALLESKQQALRNCVQNGIGVILVPTLVRGVNDFNIGEILKFATANVPGVRGVHFQPLSFFGRYPEAPRDDLRITLPEVMRRIEEQSGGLFRAADMQPPNCENALCSFHSNYVILRGGLPHLLVDGANQSASCCSQSEIDARISRTVNYVARQWRAGRDDQAVDAASQPEPDKSPGGAGSVPVCEGKCRLPQVDMPTASEHSCCRCESGPTEKTDDLDLDQFLDMVHKRSFTLSAMAFQDAWNIDLKRARECCIHVASPDNRLVPFCLYNLTSAWGETLYRGRAHGTL